MKYIITTLLLIAFSASASADYIWDQRKNWSKPKAWTCESPEHIPVDCGYFWDD